MSLLQAYFKLTSSVYYNILYNNTGLSIKRDNDDNNNYKTYH